jgi:hypothetical protein
MQTIPTSSESHMHIALLGSIEPRQTYSCPKLIHGQEKRLIIPYCFQSAFCLKFKYNSNFNKKILSFAPKNEKNEMN